MSLSHRQIEAYSRQIILRDFSGASQERLLAASILIDGSGIAARTAATYLAGAGIGRLHIAPALLEPLLFRELGQRNEDTLVHTTAPDTPADVVILTAADNPPNLPRLGYILVDQDHRGDTHLTRLPAESSLAACPACFPRETSDTLDPAAAAIAGSLAALTAIRWIAEIGETEPPARQTLARGGSIFETAPFQPKKPCECP